MSYLAPSESHSIRVCIWQLINSHSPEVEPESDKWISFKNFLKLLLKCKYRGWTRADKCKSPITHDRSLVRNELPGSYIELKCNTWHLLCSIDHSYAYYTYNEHCVHSIMCLWTRAVSKMVILTCATVRIQMCYNLDSTRLWSCVIGDLRLSALVQPRYFAKKSSPRVLEWYTHIVMPNNYTQVISPAMSKRNIRLARMRKGDCLKLQTRYR